MKRCNSFIPTAEQIQKVLPFSIEVPHGFKVHAQALCRKLLGNSYCYFQPMRGSIGNSRGYVYSAGKWVTDEDAVWYYIEGVLYFKDEDNRGMVIMAMLSKPKK